MKSSFVPLYMTGFVVLVFAGLQALTQCKPGAGTAVSTGAGVAEIVCALVLDEKGTEREICDTGAKLAELLARLLAANAQASPGGMASGAPPSSARAMASALPGPVEHQARILNLYVKRSAK